MKEHQTLYLELIKKSLWKTEVNSTLFEGIYTEGWQKILKLSGRQRTTAFITQSILSLPQPLQPSKLQQWKLLLETEKIEEANHRLNRMIAFLSEEYHHIQAPFILLKGQGVALNYPDPSKRTPGDIDLFFYRKGDYQKTKEWVLRGEYALEPESAVHMGFDIQGIHVENHRLIAHIGRKKYNKSFQKETENLIHSNLWQETQLGETKVQLLPPTFNACFLFLHLFHHFIHSGVSMRQLCDWILHLSANEEQINQQEAGLFLKQLALNKPASLFAGIAEKYLGARPGIFPVEPAFHPVLTEIIIKDILEGGHFGRYHPGRKRPCGLWAGRAHAYLATVKRSVKLVRIAPKHILLLPYTKLIHRIKLTIQIKSSDTST